MNDIEKMEGLIKSLNEIIHTSGHRGPHCIILMAPNLDDVRVGSNIKDTKCLSDFLMANAIHLKSVEGPIDSFTVIHKRQ